MGSKKDGVSVNVGDMELHEFTKLLEVASEGLKRELDSFMLKLEAINDLMRIGDHRTLDGRPKLAGPGLPIMLEQLCRVRSDILSLQTKAQETIQLASISSEYEYLDQPLEGTEDDPAYNMSPFMSSTYRPCIPQSKFDVKKVKHGRQQQTKLTLTVDLQTGKYSILKAAGKETLDNNTISHQEILHLIKSTKDKSTLDIILDGKKKQTYTFASPHARESFCMQIRQMKTMFSAESEIDQISVFIGTWNMGDASPNQSLSTWLKCSGSGKSRDRVFGVIPHDMYVIGTQETSMTEKDLVNTLKAGLKACVLVDMELVEVCSLWDIRLAILVKPEYKSFISRIQRASVRTGIANALGNKGAVAISFYFHGTSFCFINSHLTSGDERWLRRNQNYRDIIKGLTMSLGQKHLGNFDITNQFHHVFWLGDLNYRVQEDIQVLLTKIQDKELGQLLDRDQLRKAQKDKQAFCGFREADITFLPTYRLERNLPGNKYAWKKVKKTGERINAPSWCDRVLWRSYPEVFIENVAYGCSDAILSSDHRPVFSSFNVGVASEFIQNRCSLADMAPVKIIFHSIEAQVKTCCKQHFQLVFHSTCLQEVCRSQPNSSFRENRTSFYTVPLWQASNIPEMEPLFGDQEFLEEQHILVSVIAKDGDNESYGECVLALRKMFEKEPQEFDHILLHQGEETGRLKGKMHVASRDLQVRRNSSKKNYSLIAFDTEYHDPEMFIADKPKVELRRNMNGNSVISGPRGGPKTNLRNVKSYQPQQTHYETIDLDKNFPTREMTKVDRRAPAPLPVQLPGHPAVPPRKTPPYMGQTSLPTGHLSPPGIGRQTSSHAPTSAPPPVPRKSRIQSANQQPSYEEICKPLTIDDWLAGLNLSCYEQNFRDSGWDSLLYLHEMTVVDLNNMNITIDEHQDRIMASIRELNKV